MNRASFFLLFINLLLKINHNSDYLIFPKNRFLFIRFVNFLFLNMIKFSELPQIDLTVAAAISFEKAVFVRNKYNHFMALHICS